MKKPFALAFLFALLVATPLRAQDPRMSFFITSTGSGNGANLRGLEGADAHCQALADATGVSGKHWHAYLSATATADRSAVNARDRIGGGPWYNAEGTLIARDVEQLHSNGVNLTKATQLNERGEVVNGRGDSPNMHDILTGSTMNGMAIAGDGDTTCDNWTSSGQDGSAMLGHHDRQGGGDNPTSWNSAHASRGCSQANLQGTGGNGFYYCFAIYGEQQSPFDLRD